MLHAARYIAIRRLGFQDWGIVPPMRADIRAWVARLALPAVWTCWLAGCAHSTRCDASGGAGATTREHSKTSGTQYATRLRDIRELYEKGVRELSDGSDDRGAQEFHAVVHLLMYGEGNGEVLFQQIDDDGWAFACNDLTRIFALSAYRYGALLAEKGEGSAYLCIALKARPDVILPLATTERLKPGVREIFDTVKRDSHCYFENGWRARSAPTFSDLTY